MSKEQANQKQNQVDKGRIQPSGAETALAPEAEKLGIGPIQAALADPSRASRQAVRGAQRAYGNQHVQRTAKRHTVGRSLRVNDPEDQYEKEAEAVADSLQRSTTAAADSPILPGDDTPNLEGTIPTAPVQPLQRALTVSSPDDPLEKEAEAVAESLQRTPEPVPPVGEDGGDGGSGDGGGDVARSQAAEVPSATVVGGQAAGGVHRPVPTQLQGQLFQSQTAGTEELMEEELALSREGKEGLPPLGEAEGDVQRSGDGMNRDGVVHDEVAGQIDRKRGSGQPLSSPVQRRMENHMGSDFSNVRVHTDNESDSLNRSLQAEAFTTGSDIFFSRDAYQPGSESGQKLIAHELTHVVQQGSAPSKANRQEDEEEPLQLMSAEPAIQRSDEDEAREKTKEKAAEGRDKASGKKNEQEGKKGDPEAKTKSDGKAIPPEMKPNIGQPPVPKELPGVAENKMIDSSEREIPEGGAVDLGVLGWPMTKELTMPDWDDEIAKYDAFSSGDLEALGADMSQLEGYALGLGEPITVDDPEVRQQMVNDALSGGLNGGDSVGPLNYAKGMLLDSIPFAGTVAGLGTLFTKGPGEWFGEMTGGVSSAAKNIGNAWKGLGEGSGWNRAASAIELMIGILELINSIVQIVSLIALIITIVGAIFIGIGTVLAAFIFTAAAGAALLGFWTTPTIIAGIVTLACASYLVQAQLLIRVLREIAIAFRIIDMLYYESDPEKLMERQAKLAEHTTGLNQAAFENVKMGIRNEDDKGSDEEKVRTPPWEESAAEPQVIDPGIERVSRMSKDDKHSYRAQWLEKYGIDSTADQVRDELSESETEAPPLLEYQDDPLDDVVSKIDRNAIAIYELEIQEMTLMDEANETAQAAEVAQEQSKILQAARVSVAENQRMAGEHQQDIDTKLKKQDDLKGKSQDTEKTGQQGQGKSAQASGIAAVILALMKPLLPAMKSSGQSMSDDQKSKTSEAGNQSAQTTDTTVSSAQESQKEADKRKENTKKTQVEATASQQKLAETDDFLESQEEQAAEGAAELQSLHSDIVSTRDEVATARDALEEERSAAIGEAMDWMIGWREQRQELFDQMETKLATVLPEEDKQKDEDGTEKSNADFYDEDADQGKLKGYYGDADMEGEYDPDEEGEMDNEDISEFAVDY